MSFGLDYVSGPPIADMKAAGVAFVCRYLSVVNEQTKVKLLTPNEADALSQTGIALISNYEWYANRALEGAASGAADALIARDQHTACGGPVDRPIYFSVDIDTSGRAVLAYFLGIASVIGLHRTGAYGSYRVLKELFDAGAITWGWQTYAWSGGAWEPRAHIQQYQNSMSMAGASVDHNRSIKSDFGQWFAHMANAAQPQVVTLNQHGEVADFVDVSQFEGGESPDECVAYSAALLKYAGAPGHGPTGTGEQVDQLADHWYGQLEGGIAASNRAGMSLDAEYTVLKGIGLPYRALSLDISSIKRAIAQGYPVMLCGALAGMFDMDLGDIIPYPWANPSGNHCIVASGIAHDGNLLVHDPANITASGVIRTGPRRYNASKLQLISATAVSMPWLGQGEDMAPLTIADVKQYFTSNADGSWTRIDKGGKPVPDSAGVPIMLKGAIKDDWCNHGMNVLGDIGLPTGNETPVDPAHPEVVAQQFERCIRRFDPHHVEDSPPHAGAVYSVHIESLYVAGDKLSMTLDQLNALQKQLDALKAGAVESAYVAAVKEVQVHIKAMAAIVDPLAV